MTTRPANHQLSLFDTPSPTTPPLPPPVKISTKLRDNDPQKWNYSQHTGVKHNILKYYLAVWAAILASTRRPLAVVDGFAGRGRYTTGEPGSPLLVLETLAMHPNKRQQFGCHFVEKDPDNFANLAAEVQKHRAVISGRIQVYLYNASFAAASRKIMATLRAVDQPSFFFVDPFGYTDPTIDLLGEVLTLPKAEVFVNLMFQFINRALNNPNPSLADTLDRCLGTPAWRDLIELSGDVREREFINLYRSQLKLRGANFVIPFRTNDDSKDRTLYYLVHGAKHIKAAKLMKDAMVASGSSGELGYSGEARQGMFPLFSLGTMPLRELLAQVFAGQEVTFDEVIARTIEDSGACCEKHYRTAIKELRDAGRVVIKDAWTPTGKKSTAIAGPTLIRFNPF